MSEPSNTAGALTIGGTVGNYRISGKIGEGGMGAVYLASHPLLGRKAAVKILLPEHSKRSDLVSRFFNEAKTAAALRHPALVDVFDFGFLADGSAYIVMDFLEGESLANRIERAAPLRPEEVVDFGRQIALGVGAAHGQGIVHRDLKPDNVFLVPDPETPGRERVKILDFGIAKLIQPHGSGSKGATATGMVLGTPLFMAPEQCRGAGQVDHRADIYSLGCILYLMLTSKPPFDYEGVGEILGAHLHEKVKPLRAINVTVPEALEAVVLRALEKRPEDRQQNMGVLAAELQAALGLPAPGASLAGVPLGTTTVLPVSGTSAPGSAPSTTARGPGRPSAAFAPTTLSAAAATQSLSPETEVEVPRARGRAPLVVGGVLLIGAVAAGGAVWFKSRSTGPSPAETLAALREAAAKGTPAAPAVTAPASAPAAAVPGPAAQPPNDPAPPVQGAATGAAPEPAAVVAEPEPAQEPAPDPKPTLAARQDESRTVKKRQPEGEREKKSRGLERAMELRQRGDEAEALHAFRAALREGRLSSADRAEAERNVIALQRKFGEIEVTCDVAGADVAVDGRSVGRTPLHRSVLIRPGAHTITITHAGYKPLNRRFSISAGERQPFRFQIR